MKKSLLFCAIAVAGTFSTASFAEDASTPSIALADVAVEQNIELAGTKPPTQGSGIGLQAQTHEKKESVSLMAREKPPGVSLMAREKPPKIGLFAAREKPPIPHS